MSRLFRSLSFRLALFYAVLLCVSVALVAAIGYRVWVAWPMQEIESEVDREADETARVLQNEGIDATRLVLEQRMRSAGVRKSFHALIAPDGEIVSANLPSWPRRPSSHMTLIEADTFLDGFEDDYTALVRDRTFADGTRLLVGRDVEDILREDELLRTAALWIVCVTLVLGLAGGWLMSRAIGQRIETLARTARQVMDGDLSERVPVRGTSDDFDRLNETINLMLSRIEALFGTARRVSENVAHEFRTPLARLLTRLEALEQLEPEGTPAREEVDNAIAEVNRLQRIFAALLRISRLEGGRHPLHIQRCDIVSLLEDLVEFYQPEADARGIELVLDAQRPLVAELDLDLMFQALSNLLDNALKYVPGGGRIEAFASGEGALHIGIADNGPGLSREEAARVTEPFSRGEDTAGRAGEGLGLSMVAAIAQVHGARFRLEDNRPGLRALLIVPPGLH
ncbi:sensor histidine kinase [Novosphingobium clariflavum]|uniref:histidine kinase n=1 Tax=Novosphingobium clariflavum TaxID=2029884 RepID=A0ABV6S736_9SPHN|nr:HAMP domain-containing sensor histidine kinase [Novosphingobium clariflavum]